MTRQFRWAGPFALVVALLAEGGCSGGSSAVKDSGSDVPKDFTTDLSCGGLVHSDGTAPNGTVFAASAVVVTALDFKQIEIAIYDVATHASLTFAIPVDTGADAGFPEGALTVRGALFPPQTMADVVLDIQRIEAPWTPKGKSRIQAAFTLSGSGWAVAGSFDSPVCNVVATG
jgi:hypothetical protein